MERHRRYFIGSVLAGAGGVLGVQSCRLMAKEAFPHVYFVGCDAYWPLLALFAAGLTAAAFFVFAKKPPRPSSLARWRRWPRLYRPAGSAFFPLPVFRHGGGGRSLADV